jgi:hypothetical protein
VVKGLRMSSPINPDTTDPWVFRLMVPDGLSKKRIDRFSASIIQTTNFTGSQIVSNHNVT